VPCSANRAAPQSGAHTTTTLSDFKDLGAASAWAAGPEMNMHNLSLLHATPWHAQHLSSSNALHPAHDAPKAPQPIGLSQAELRRIILDLIG
jgi:hypothetical protein